MSEQKAVVKVIQNEEAPVERNVLAQAIVEISAAMMRLSKTGLTRDAIIVLTHDALKPYGPRYNRQKPTRRDVQCVFDALDALAKEFVK